MAKSPLKLPLKVFGYVRVSTEDQAKEGLSIPAQKAKIQAYASLNDLELVEIIADKGFSGKNLDRPGVKKLLDLVRDQNADGVIVYKLDRLSRSTKDLLRLIEEVFQKGNTRFFSISEQIDTETAIGKFFLTLMGALAQMERELIAERTKATLAYKKQKGEHLGAIPYGFKLVEGKLIPHEPEQKILKKMKRWRYEGKTLREVARRLNQEEIPTHREGVKWSHKTVSCVLS
jgi:DNA invertase Pin-like site-specific DNA recombinase